MRKQVEGIMEGVLERLVGGILKEKVRELSLEYNFEYEEGVKKVGLEGITIKGISKREKDSKKGGLEVSRIRIPLPFCGKEEMNHCVGIRLNHGLYTQCTNSRGSKDLCGTCEKQASKNTDNKPTYGLICDRISNGDGFRDPKGKIPTRYGNVMEKLNITRGQAEEEAARQGVTIPESEFEIKKAQRGRPKKDTSANDTSDEDTPKKQRGRPKKEKKMINNNTGDELIQELVNNVQEKEATTKSPCNMGVEGTSPTNQQNGSLGVEGTVPTTDTSDDEEETAVRIFKYNGVKYLKAADNTIYDFESHEEIGSWNEKTNSIEVT